MRNGNGPDTRRQNVLLRGNELLAGRTSFYPGPLLGFPAGDHGPEKPVSFNEIIEKTLDVHLGILIIRIDTCKHMCLDAIMVSVV